MKKHGDSRAQWFHNSCVTDQSQASIASVFRIIGQLDSIVQLTIYRPYALAPPEDTGHMQLWEDLIQ